MARRLKCGVTDTRMADGDASITMRLVSNLRRAELSTTRKAEGKVNTGTLGGVTNMTRWPEGEKCVTRGPEVVADITRRPGPEKSVTRSFRA